MSLKPIKPSKSRRNSKGPAAPVLTLEQMTTLQAMKSRRDKSNLLQQVLVQSPSLNLTSPQAAPTWHPRSKSTSQPHR